MKTSLGTLALLAVACATTPPDLAAQSTGGGPAGATTLGRDFGSTYELLARIDRMHGIVLSEVASLAASAREGRSPASAEAESARVRALIERVEGDRPSESVASRSAAGYAAVGSRAAEVIAWGHTFQLEVLGILAEPHTEDRRVALAEAVDRYRSRPGVALPAAPKDMDVLYDHPHAFAFRDRFPELDGFVWAGLWLKLAATEPLTDFSDGAERAAGLDTVVTRYHAKLSFGEPPRAFPTQIPLAPAIAPGLIFLSPETAMIWDNLSLLQEVLADILASADVTDAPTAIDAAVDLFLDPTLRVTERGDWESMALRHGIFFQGGYPLAVMTQSELNGDGHAAHIRAGAAPRPMPIIPN